VALLIVVAFIAGLVTAVSPCVLPILPIVLATGVGNDRRRPYLVIAGLIASFSFFTLASVQIINALHLPSATLRTVAIAIVALFGLTLAVPALSERFERAVARLPVLGDRIARMGAPSTGRAGIPGGIITGIGLGLIWTPCAGPILGAVTSLAVTAPGSGATLALVVAYAVGAGIPLLAIALGGRAAVARLRLRSAAHWGGRAMGIVVLATAGLMAAGADTAISSDLTSALPNWTGTLQTLERSDQVQAALHDLGVGPGPSTPADSGGPTSGLEQGPLAPDFALNRTWLNSSPQTLAGLRGKVVLVDFWTYSCINCIRTLPYVEGWYQKYAADGFVVVGVHTPEFAFEHDAGNVSAAIARFGLTYPVVLDNDYAIWNAYSNQYWPADYLIDATGHLRATHFGEGDYAQTEADIVGLLAEAGSSAVPSPASSAPPPPISQNQTPETYVGTARGRNFASPEGVQTGSGTRYSFPRYLPDDAFAVSGYFDFQPEYVVATGAGSSLEMSFMARDVYLVLAADSPVPATVEVTGVVGAAATEDVAADGSMTIGAARLYHLVHLPAPGRGVVTITFGSPGARAYAFTFGS
jgi:cytochrome c biogenesis protein CcdA/thiol-disulfide isomerase/thioredoxin